jgi:hypothetical protein
MNRPMESVIRPSFCGRTNSALVCRGAVLACTFPLRTSSAVQVHLRIVGLELRHLLREKPVHPRAVTMTSGHRPVASFFSGFSAELTRAH